jgi:hypothetical protein
LGSASTRGSRKRHEAVGHLAEEHLQRAALHLEVVAVEDLLGDRLVVARLRFQGVDDGGGADLEIALRLGELLVDRGLLRFGQRHVVLREQHVEIRLRGAQPQVLLREREHRLRLQHRGAGLVDGDPVLHAEDRLRERDREGVGGVVAVGRAVALGIVAEDRGAAVHLRQVARPRLRQALGGGLVLRARRLVDLVAQQRVAVDAEEVGGLAGRASASASARAKGVRFIDGP